MQEPMAYSAELYDELDCGDFRVRFPVETVRLSDQELFDKVAATEDDMDDADWRILFST